MDNGLINPAINQITPGGISIYPANNVDIYSLLPDGVSHQNKMDIANVAQNGWILSNGIGHIITNQENENLVLQYVTHPSLYTKPIADALLGHARRHGMTHVVGAVPDNATGLHRTFFLWGARPYVKLTNGMHLWAYPSKNYYNNNIK